MPMMKDSLYTSRDKQSVIVQCSCGIGVDHGQIEFAIDPPFDGHAGLWVGAGFPPVWGFRRRLKAAWLILRGKAVTKDFFMSASLCGELSDWFAYAHDQAKTRTSNGPAMSLKEIRDLMKKPEGTRPGASGGEADPPIKNDGTLPTEPVEPGEDQ